MIGEVHSDGKGELCINRNCVSIVFSMTLLHDSKYSLVRHLSLFFFGSNMGKIMNFVVRVI